MRPPAVDFRDDVAQRRIVRGREQPWPIEWRPGATGSVEAMAGDAQAIEEFLPFSDIGSALRSRYDWHRERDHQTQQGYSHGVGFHGESSGIFLKCELVTNRAFRY
jgi:hypothetical protein